MGPICLAVIEYLYYFLPINENTSDVEIGSDSSFVTF